MSPIPITEANRSRIEAVLREAEGRAHARTLGWGQVLRCVDQASDLLERWLESPADRVGAVALCHDGERRAFKGRSYESTFVTIRRTARGWTLVAAARTWTPTYSSPVRFIRLAGTARDRMNRTEQNWYRQRHDIEWIATSSSRGKA